ncbi:hypothetical protein [Fretibacter rubidus]|uniref:hypothetical protein n=1 Tax=Fretibacter rubidus TaxID=570162 RepID=UPI00352B264E
MSAIIWIHEDALRADHPVFAAAGTDAQVVFIWDDAYFTAQGYSFKRLVFIYECLLDLPVILCKGDMATVLSGLIEGRDLYVPTTPNPDYQTVAAVLSKTTKVHYISETPLTFIETEPDMKRFFRYWNKAKKSALSKDGLP